MLNRPGYLAPDRTEQALLSSGVRQEFVIGAPGTSVRAGQLDHESPEQRVLRVAYNYSADEIVAQGVALAFCDLRNGVDASQTLERILIPPQGIAVSIPAGIMQARFQGLDNPQNAQGTLNATVSAGFLSRRWIATDQSFQTVPQIPAVLTLAAPPFATRVNVFVLAGDIANPVGVPLLTIGQQQTVGIVPQGGIIQLSSTVANSAVIITWEITQ